MASSQRTTHLKSGVDRRWAANKAGAWMWSTVRFIIIIGLCYVILYPFLVKFLNAIKGYDDFFDPTVRFIAREPTWDNIRIVFQTMNYVGAAVRTTLLSLGCAVIQTAVCALIAYGFARFHFRGNGILFFCVILTLLIPPQTIMIPLYMKFRFFLGNPDWSLIDSVFPMILLSFTGMGLKNGLYIFMLRQVFRGMPAELEEAAYIDGAGYFRTFRSIMLPAAVPSLTTVFLFVFAWQWTDTFYNNLFFVNFEVLTTAMNNVRGLSEVDIIQSMYGNTAALLAIVPLAVFYIFTQRAFVQSAERSGIVG